jgi:bifunctional DNA-binding transcriptional regulator/antitoxin component of YhaV-PrlF toxin-antitoxin module
MAKKSPERTYHTRAFKVSKASISVRSTIPEPVAVLLGIEDGTDICWTVNGDTRKVWISKGKA